MYRAFEENQGNQAKLKTRWNNHCSKESIIAYVLVPRYAAEGFFKDQDKLDVIQDVEDFADRHFDGLGLKATEELVEYISRVSSLTGTRRLNIMKMDAKQYWNVLGRTDFPILFECAKIINEMICSSEASERVWSIFRFIHSRMRNRLTDEKVTKLAFIYVNAAIVDKDKTDYMAELGAVLTGIDCEDDDDF